MSVQMLLSVFLVLISLQGSSSNFNFKTITSKEWTQTAKANGKMLVVFYKEVGCPSCQAFLDVVATLVGDQDLDEDIQVSKSIDTNLASDLGLGSFPVVVYLRENSYVIFDGMPETDDVLEWLERSRSKVTQILNDDSFEHLTQASSGATTGDWLVAFYEDKCNKVLPELESVGVRIHHKTNVASVDVSKNRILAERFSIRKCPEIILFKQGKMYRYELPKLDQASLKSFVDVWYKNSKAEMVLPPKSRFDFVTESIADYIKKQIHGEHHAYVITALSGIVFGFLLILLCCCHSFISAAGTSRKQKSD